MIADVFLFGLRNVGMLFFQAALGKGKKEKGNDIMPLWVLINGEKFALGTLSVEQCRQITFDLVFEKEFELSHDWKNGSVYFCGYSVDNPFAYPLFSLLIVFNFLCLQFISFLVIHVFMNIEAYTLLFTPRLVEFNFSMM